MPHIDHHQRPASLENTLAYQVPTLEQEIHYRDMAYNKNKVQKGGLNSSASQGTLDPIHAAAVKNPGKLPFVPVNNSYKKVYPNMHEEINHENFGAIKPI